MENYWDYALNYVWRPLECRGLEATVSLYLHVKPSPTTVIIDFSILESIPHKSTSTSILNNLEIHYYFCSNVDNSVQKDKKFDFAKKNYNHYVKSTIYAIINVLKHIKSL